MRKLAQLLLPGSGYPLRQQTHVVELAVVEYRTAEVVYDDHKETYRNIPLTVSR